MEILGAVSCGEMVSQKYNQFFRLKLNDNLPLNFVLDCKLIVIRLITQQTKSLLFS